MVQCIFNMIGHDLIQRADGLIRALSRSGWYRHVGR
jgi:hypothetical protein